MEILVGPGHIPVETDHCTALHAILNKYGAANAMSEIFPCYA